MTEQEIFNKVVKRLRNGKGRAALRGDNNNLCVYYDPDTGNKCAVGIFIRKNSKISSYIGDVYSLVEVYRDRVPAIIRENADLFTDLQNVHDSTQNWDGNKFNECGEAVLRRVAKKYKLTYGEK